MSTDGRYVFSDGVEFKSQVQALLHLKNYPDLRVVFSEPSFEDRDVTERFRSILADRRFGGVS